jgi:hypothetical protein
MDTGEPGIDKRGVGYIFPGIRLIPYFYYALGLGAGAFLGEPISPERIKFAAFFFFSFSASST